MAEQLLLSLDRPNTEIDKIWAKEAEARIDGKRQTNHTLSFQFFSRQAMTRINQEFGHGSGIN